MMEFLPYGKSTPRPVQKIKRAANGDEAIVRVAKKTIRPTHLRKTPVSQFLLELQTHNLTARELLQR
jgi:hypothetical protein